jgi:hypothetical protein
MFAYSSYDALSEMSQGNCVTELGTFTSHISRIYRGSLVHLLYVLEVTSNCLNVEKPTRWRPCHPVETTYMASRRAPTDSHSRLMEHLTDPVLLPRQRSDPRDTPKEFPITVSITTLLSCGHLKKMTDSLIVKKSVVFYVTRSFITVLTRARYWTHLGPAKSS